MFFGRIWTSPLAQWLECLPMIREIGVQSQVESYLRLKKWYLMPPCIMLSIVRYGLRVKWSNSGKGVVPSPTTQCSNDQKWSHWVALNYGCQLHFYKQINRKKCKILQRLCDSSKGITSEINPLAKDEQTLSRLHIDFLGPMKGQYYSIVVGYFSKWPEEAQWKDNII